MLRKKSKITKNAADTINVTVPRKNDNLAMLFFVLAPATDNTKPIKEPAKAVMYNALTITPGRVALWAIIPGIKNASVA